jgi:phenol hydroxylase P1 protein
MEKNFAFVEKHNLITMLPDDVKQIVCDIIVPLRHIEWGANMNNCAITDDGYGVAITQVTMYNTMDRLAIAQYITRIGLMLGGNNATVLDEGKASWLNDEAWQGLRHVIEDSFVLDDWFELMVAQNIVMDGMIYPLIYGQLIDKLVRNNGSSVAMLTEFMSEWYPETVRWTNALMKVTAKESEANSELLSDWVKQWSDRVELALIPVAEKGFGDDGKAQVAQAKQILLERLSKQGIKV